MAKSIGEGWQQILLAPIFSNDHITHWSKLWEMIRFTMVPKWRESLGRLKSLFGIQPQFFVESVSEPHLCREKRYRWDKSEQLSLTSSLLRVSEQSINRESTREWVKIHDCILFVVKDLMANKEFRQLKKLSILSGVGKQMAKIDKAAQRKEEEEAKASKFWGQANEDQGGLSVCSRLWLCGKGLVERWFEAKGVWRIIGCSMEYFLFACHPEGHWRDHRGNKIGEYTLRKDVTMDQEFLENHL